MSSENDSKNRKKDYWKNNPKITMRIKNADDKEQ